MYQQCVGTGEDYANSRRAFRIDEQQPLFSHQAVKLTSSRTQLPYEYYSLPFCQPSKITYKAENLGKFSSLAVSLSPRGSRIFTWRWQQLTLTSLCAAHIAAYSSLITALGGSCCFYTHFTGSVTCLWLYF